ncbi:hypothetical protein D049_2409B, partial [Vibrio parahaemolyticus VPTS-2010]
RFKANRCHDENRQNDRQAIQRHIRRNLLYAKRISQQRKHDREFHK